MLALQCSALAVEINVGGARLNIPAPEGYAPVTSDMQPYAETAKQFVSPSSQQFALFIPDEFIAIARKGGFPDTTRRFEVWAPRVIIGKTVSKESFDDLKKGLNAQNEENIKQIDAEFPDIRKKIAGILSKNFDASIGITGGRMIPLPVHDESGRSIAFSSLTSYTVETGGGESLPLEAAITTTYLLVREKVIVLYVADLNKDLAWSRAAAKAWADVILAENASGGASASDGAGAAVVSGTDGSAGAAGSAGGARDAKGDAEAFARCLMAAKQGDADAQYKLAGMYATGRGVEQSYIGVVKWLRNAAEQGHRDAQVHLGMIYQDGIGGVAEDDAEAIKWYRMAAKQGDESAQSAIKFLEDAPETARQQRALAEQGDADAQCYLATLYARGRGVPQSYAEAAKWIRKAAEQGRAVPQFLLGRIYSEGKGVAQSDVEAAKWYRKAAEQGYQDAQYELGAAYAFGLGVDKNDAEAVNWYRKAAEQGQADAQGVLKGMGLTW